MDVRNWSVEQIMQLPDCAFGRKWPIYTTIIVEPVTVIQRLIDQPLPEKIVLWNAGFLSGYIPSTASTYKLALGDSEPGSDVEFDRFERLFKGDFDEPADEGVIYLGGRSSIDVKIRMPLHTMGRRFAIQVINPHATETMVMNFALVISSFPTEVPDWLLSGPAGSL